MSIDHDVDSYSPEHLYKQIADRFRSEIGSGLLKLNDRIPTEMELSESYQVSRGTVRKALDRLVGEGLLVRIKGKGTFVSGTAVGSRSQQIGIVVPWLYDHLISEMIRGVETSLREHGYTLLLGHSDGDVDTEADQVKRFLDQKVAGIILFPVQDREEIAPVNAEIPSGFPLVVLDRRLFGRESDLVLCDNRKGAFEAVSALIEAGHRSIACVSTISRPSSVVDRINGYEQAMRAHGLIPLSAINADVKTEIRGKDENETALFTFSESDFHELRQLLSSPYRPTALFCINDYLAFSVLEYLSGEHIAVPEDISLIGFDDHPFASHAQVKLSSVAQDAVQIGSTAARLLLMRIGDPGARVETRMVSGRLVLRDSIARVNT